MPREHRTVSVKPDVTLRALNRVPTVPQPATTSTTRKRSRRPRIRLDDRDEEEENKRVSHNLRRKRVQSELTKGVTATYWPAQQQP